MEIYIKKNQPRNEMNYKPKKKINKKKTCPTNLFMRIDEC